MFPSQADLRLIKAIRLRNIYPRQIHFITEDWLGIRRIFSRYQSESLVRSAYHGAVWWVAGNCGDRDGIFHELKTVCKELNNSGLKEPESIYPIPRLFVAG